MRKVRKICTQQLDNVDLGLSMWPLPLLRHLRLRALLPNVSLPSVPRTSARRRFLDPAARPAGDVLRLLARFSVRVPCV